MTWQQFKQKVHIIPKSSENLWLDKVGAIVIWQHISNCCWMVWIGHQAWQPKPMVSKLKVKSLESCEAKPKPKPAENLWTSNWNQRGQTISIRTNHVQYTIFRFSELHYCFVWLETPLRRENVFLTCSASVQYSKVPNLDHKWDWKYWSRFEMRCEVYFL